MRASCQKVVHTSAAVPPRPTAVPVWKRRHAFMRRFPRLLQMRSRLSMDFSYEMLGTWILAFGSLIWRYEIVLAPSVWTLIRTSLPGWHVCRSMAVNCYMGNALIVKVCFDCESGTRLGIAKPLVWSMCNISLDSDSLSKLFLLKN